MQLGGLPEAIGLQSIADSPATKPLSEWILQNDHSQALAKLVQQRQPRRLGIYYEMLWQYVFEHYPNFQLLCQNLAVTQNNRTLGEMDFVYFCQHRQQQVHLETAVKFYLGAAKTSHRNTTTALAYSWSQWLGPGCKDRLDLKLLKMLNQQSQLAFTPAGIDTLKQAKVSKPLREICLKGYFFYPLIKSCEAPVSSHPQHARGYWLALKDIDLLRDQVDNWQLLKKEQWLAPAILEDARQLLSLSDLSNDISLRFASNPFPVMVANMQACGAGYRESSRYFITPDHWPEIL